MKSIAELYLSYLEMTIISMVLASLAFISVSGWAYGGSARVPATLACLTLGLIVFVAIDRRRASDVHAQFRKEPFGETKLFWLLLQRRVSRIAGYFNPMSARQAQTLSRIVAIIISALTIAAVWASFSISAQITTLKKNQARVSAAVGRPATFFNSALVIDVLQITDGDSPRVIATLKADGYSELRIEGEGPGYETIYEAGPIRFLVRILEIDSTTVRFFVERQGKYPA